MTVISAMRYVDCPFSAAIEFAEKASQQHSDAYVSPSDPLAVRVNFAAAATEDTTDGARKHDALLVAWRPHARGMFPDFRGVLTVRPRNRGVYLRLDGEYEPPFGAAGKAFDALAGRAIAKRTMHRFLADFAQRIEREYARERAVTSTAR